MTGPVCIKKAGSRWSGCVCDPCRKHRNRIQKLRRAGVSTSSPNEAAWQRLEDLLAAGWTITAIADAAGISFQAIHLAITRRGRGEQKYLQHKNAWAILAIPHDETTQPGWAAPLGIRRRLQALACLGWSVGAILAAAPGVGVDGRFSPDTLTKIRRGHVRGRVQPDTARFIRAVYGPLSSRTPPAGQWAEQTRQRAIAAGWAPPAAWDDDAQLDDPAAEPMVGIPVDLDEIRVIRCAAGKLHGTNDLSIAEREAVVRLLHREGMSDRAIAARTQITDRTVFRIRHRLGLVGNTVESYGQVAG